jgi:hypothetical protein
MSYCHDTAMFSDATFGIYPRDVSPVSSISSEASTVGPSPFAYRPPLTAPHPMPAYGAGIPGPSHGHAQTFSSRQCSTRPFDGVAAGFAFSSVRSTAPTSQSGYYLPLPSTSVPLPADRCGVSLDGSGGGRVPSMPAARTTSASNRRTPPYTQGRESELGSDPHAIPRISRPARESQRRDIVATPAVALASQSRRKREAIFQCSMCPSSFTKKINLEGVFIIYPSRRTSSYVLTLSRPREISQR